MRKTKLSEEEVLAAEKAADDRKRNRANGFSLMNDRDRGFRTFDNGITMLWPTERELIPGEARTYVPSESFVLVVDGRNYLFDTEDFRKTLRWA